MKLLNRISKKKILSLYINYILYKKNKQRQQQDLIRIFIILEYKRYYIMNKKKNINFIFVGCLFDFCVCFGKDSLQNISMLGKQCHFVGNVI